MIRSRPSERSRKRIERAIHEGYVGHLEQRIRAMEAEAATGSRSRRTSSTGRPQFVLGVTTFNRRDYLKRFVESFIDTRTESIQWTLIIADDGSNDGSWEYVRSIDAEDLEVIAIRNNGLGVAGQTNTILRAAVAVGFDFGFKADDDIFFRKPGWAELYYRASIESGFDHLVYHNREWKSASHDKAGGQLRSQVAAIDCMGCFYTFTERVIAEVGYFDEVNFPVRGHSHIDFTIRCCRSGLNEASQLWDVAESDLFIGMWERDNYVDLTDWASEQVQVITSEPETKRRLDVIGDASRLRVSYSEGAVPRSRIAVLGSIQTNTKTALENSGAFYYPTSVNRDYDAVFVINLFDDHRKWAATSAQLSDAGIFFERHAAVFGGSDVHLPDWASYAEQGLRHPVEHQIGRRLIQSPGAWGYLLTYRSLLQKAKDRRLRNILVFDDDIRLHKSFSKLYQSAREEIEHDPDILYLGVNQRDWTAVSTVGDHLYSPNDKIDGSYAVGISGRLYDQLLRETEGLVWPFDAGPLRNAALSTLGSSYVVYPNLVIPDVSSSHIRKPRSLERMSERARWDLDSYQNREPAEPRRLSPDETITIAIPPSEDPAELFDSVESLRQQEFSKLRILIGVGEERAAWTVAESLSRQDPRIVLYKALENQSPVSILNRMLTSEESEYVAVVTAQTVSSGTRFARALECLGAKGADVVLGSLIVNAVIPVGRSVQQRIPTAMRDSTIGSKRFRTVDLMRRQLLEAAGGVLRADEKALVEVVDRLKAASQVIETVVLEDPSGFTRNSPRTGFDRGQLSRHRLISDGKLSPYVTPDLGGSYQVRTASNG